MARFGVSPEKEEALSSWMEALGIREEDLEENFIRGGGKGGQKINKSSTCVQLIHRPSGIEIRCQQERSQALNRFFARRLLCIRIDAQLRGKESAEKQAQEKIRRQKRRRSRRSKQKMVDNKTHRGGVKSLRQRVRGGED